MREVPHEVLGRYASLSGRPSRPFGTGLINDTFLVEGRDGDAVVQRLHPVFSPAVHHDIEAVTARLAERGVATPTLVRADDGALWVERPRDDGSPGVWRAMTFVRESHTWDKVPSAAVAREAGALVGRFHAALDGLDWAYQGRKGRAHDTARHLDALARALDEHPAHRLHAEASRVAGELLEAARPLADFTALPARHAHGDLKISNLLFDARDRGLCLVDLDTVGRMAWPHEMGDALRSWCNPAGEDHDDVELDEGLFAAAIEGYAGAGPRLVTDAERALLVDGLATICVELSARFLADALHERYFGWDPARYAARGEHNLVRARGQWALARSVLRRKDALRALTARLLG
jgi:Ser/Thr protein kinase RdoA (MazF antagonist)